MGIIVCKKLNRGLQKIKKVIITDYGSGCICT